MPPYPYMRFAVPAGARRGRIGTPRCGAADARTDPAGRPNELFPCGGKTSSAPDAILGDAAVVTSVALQYGISAAALRKSVAIRAVRKAADWRRALI
jgi:hypothetical protein